MLLLTAVATSPFWIGNLLGKDNSATGTGSQAAAIYTAEQQAAINAQRAAIHQQTQAPVPTGSVEQHAELSQQRDLVNRMLSRVPAATNEFKRYYNLLIQAGLLPIVNTSQLLGSTGISTGSATRRPLSLKEFTTQHFFVKPIHMEAQTWRSWAEQQNKSAYDWIHSRNQMLSHRGMDSNLLYPSAAARDDATWDNKASGLKPPTSLLEAYIGKPGHRLIGDTWRNWISGGVSPEQKRALIAARGSGMWSSIWGPGAIDYNVLDISKIYDMTLPHLIKLLSKVVAMSRPSEPIVEVADGKTVMIVSTQAPIFDKNSQGHKLMTALAALRGDRKRLPPFHDGNNPGSAVCSAAPGLFEYNCPWCGNKGKISYANICTNGVDRHSTLEIKSGGRVIEPHATYEDVLETYLIAKSREPRAAAWRNLWVFAAAYSGYKYATGERGCGNPVRFQSVGTGVTGPRYTVTTGLWSD